MRFKKAQTAVFASAGDRHNFAMLGFPGKRDMADMMRRFRESLRLARIASNE